MIVHTLWRAQEDLAFKIECIIYVSNYTYYLVLSYQLVKNLWVDKYRARLSDDLATKIPKYILSSSIVKVLEAAGPKEKKGQRRRTRTMNGTQNQSQSGPIVSITE